MVPLLLSSGSPSTPINPSSISVQEGAGLFLYHNKVGLGLTQSTRDTQAGDLCCVWQVYQLLIYLLSSDQEMEPQLENAKLPWLSVWFSADAERLSFFFIFLTPMEECELVLGAKTNKLEEDLYHIQPQKDGNYKRQKKWLWHAP